MRLRHPAVQRDYPGQQAKTDYAQQPDVVAQRLAVKRGEIQRAETLPHQPAGQRQQQRAETSERKPQLAGGAASGQEHAAQGHDFSHHHQRAEVAGDNGTDRGGHQQVNQQAVGFGVLMAVPVDIKQADKQPAQAKGYQPDGVQRRKLNGVVNQRDEGVDGLPVDQDNPPAASVIRLPTAPPIPAITPLSVLWKARSSAGQRRRQTEPRRWSS